MTQLPMPVVCECGFSTMDATKAAQHAETHLNTQIVVRAAETLGLGQHGWVAAFTRPTNGKTYYRQFHYKADAEKLRQEAIQNFQSLGQVLGHYGSKYWTELEED